MRIPLPTYDDLPMPILVEKADEWVRWYLNVRPWLCKCGLRVFGRAKKCPACSELRPPYFVEKEK